MTSRKTRRTPPNAASRLTNLLLSDLHSGSRGKLPNDKENKSDNIDLFKKNFIVYLSIGT